MPSFEIAVFIHFVLLSPLKQARDIVGIYRAVRSTSKNNILFKQISICSKQAYSTRELFKFSKRQCEYICLPFFPIVNC